MNHYTYITHSPDGRFYIGVRSCHCDPSEDDYMGSHSDETYHPSRKRVLATFDSREAAVSHEIYLHDLRDVGRNPRYANRVKQATTGFDRSGVPLPDYAREKISKTHKGRPSHLRGTTFLDERRALQCEITRGERNGMYGKTHSEEARAKLREANLGKTVPPEIRSKLSKSSSEWWSSEKGLETRERFSKEFAGENNPFYGKSHSEETRERLSEAHKGKTISEEHRKIVSETFKGRPKGPEQRKKMSAAQKGRKWFHDPLTGKRTKCWPDECPEGYVPGSGKKDSATTAHPVL